MCIAHGNIKMKQEGVRIMMIINSTHKTINHGLIRAIHIVKPIQDLEKREVTVA